MNPRALILMLLPLLILAACESSETTQPVTITTSEATGQPAARDHDNYASLLIEAEELQQAAADAGAEWLQTGSLISEARHQAEQENWGEAIDALSKAKRQSELALAQAEHESDAWKSRVLQ
jgi:hypothetical protein